MRAIGIAIPFFRRRSGVPIDAQAQAHFNRVIADGGVVPSGLSGVNAFFSAVKAIYGTSDINTAISAAYDAHYLGYKLGAGSGTTLGQAAQKLYAPKGIFGGIGTGSAYWEGVGVMGNNVTTPAIVSPTTQLDVVSYVYASTGHTGSATIISNDGTNRNFVFNCLTVSTGILQLRAGTPFTNFNSTTGVGNFDNYTGWIRATYNQNGANGDVTFYTSTNSPNTPINSITWVQLGSVVSSASTGLQTGTHNIQLGSNNSANNFTGRIGIAAFSTSIGGSPSVLFNANQYTGANTWTSTTSEVWTVNSTGAGLADVTQTTAASQPLLLAHTGDNYWFGSGVASNFVSTPSAAANQITGDIEIVVNASFDNLGTTYFLCSKIAGPSNYAYEFTRDSSNRLLFSFSTTGSNQINVQSTVIQPFAIGVSGWLKVVRNSTTGDVTFSTSTNEITYTQLGAVVNSTTGSMFAGTRTLGIAASSAGTGVLQGRIFRLTIANSIGGTPVVDFNPASYNPATSQTQWSSATGEVWSLNVGTAATGYKGVLVDRSIVQGDGVDDFISRAEIILSQFTVYNANRGFAGTGNQGLFGRNGFNNLAVLYNSATSLTIFKEGAYNYGTMAISRLNMISVAYDSTSLQGFVNNVQLVNNTSGTLITQGITSLLRGRTDYSNALIATHIESSTKNNSTQQTAIYNYIRSLNNNAF